jgi:hypothetical protein
MDLSGALHRGCRLVVDASVHRLADYLGLAKGSAVNRDPASGKTCRMRNMQLHQLCLFRRSHQVAGWHPRISRWSLGAILFISVFPTYCLAGEEKPISITVVADHTKANGDPWDGIPGVGGGRGPTTVPILNKNAAPDLAICVVRLETPAECRMRYVNLKQYSLCQNSYNCIFKRVSIPDGPFGLIILDLDLRRNDLVGFLLMTAGEALTPDERAALESEIRRRADQLAPPFSQGEKQRRLSEMLVVPMDRCAEAKGCRLFQSEIHVNSAE